MSLNLNAQGSGMEKQLYCFSSMSAVAEIIDGLVREILDMLGKGEARPPAHAIALQLLNNGTCLVGVVPEMKLERLKNILARLRGMPSCLVPSSARTCVKMLGPTCHLELSSA